ncbi:COP9 signalosome complex subunit 1, partial [Tremellales sp. Uapishka_1]
MAATQSSLLERGIVDQIVSQIDAATFDWTAFEGTYRGRSLITRLMHIPHTLLNSAARPTPQSRQLAATALLRLIPLIKTTSWDTSTYLQAVRYLDYALHPEQHLSKKEDETMEAGSETEGVPDHDWVEEMKQLERQENGKLTVELTSYMSNLIKESIRLTFMALVQLNIKCGHYGVAIKQYNNVREYSTTPAHQVELGLGILETSLVFLNVTQLAGHITKLEAQLDRLHPSTQSKVTAPLGDAQGITAGDLRASRENQARSADVRRAVGIKIRVARGLLALQNREFEKAARELGEIGEEGGLGEWEGCAISTADIAVIVGLCVLATCSRDRIRTTLLDRTSFRAGVDESDKWVMDLVRAFMDASYSEVMEICKKAEPGLLLNPHLSASTTSLLKMIQTRSITQYVLPFSSVKISIMSQAFGLSEGDMLIQVEDLVAKKQVEGKIDLIDKILVIQKKDERKDLFKNAWRVGTETTKSTMAALLRMRLMEANIVVDSKRGGSTAPIAISDGSIVVDDDIEVDGELEAASEGGLETE